MSVFDRKIWTLSKSVLRKRGEESNITTSAATFEIMYVSEERGRTCQLAMLILEDEQRRTDIWRMVQFSRRENMVQLGEHFERNRQREEHITASWKLQSCKIWPMGGRQGIEAFHAFFERAKRSRSEIMTR
jgi:hypothetical protein